MTNTPLRLDCDYAMPVDNIISYFLLSKMENNEKLKQSEIYQSIFDVYHAKTKKKARLFDRRNITIVARAWVCCEEADGHLHFLKNTYWGFEYEVGKVWTAKTAFRFAMARPDSARALATTLNSTLDSILITAAKQIICPDPYKSLAELREEHKNQKQASKQ